MRTTYKITKRFKLFNRKKILYDLIATDSVTKKRTVIATFKNYRDACVIKKLYETI